MINIKYFRNKKIIIFLILLFITLFIIIFNSIKTYEDNVNKNIIKDINEIKVSIDKDDYSTAIDIANDRFNKISPMIYNKSYELICELTKTLVNTSEGRQNALSILSKLDKYKYLSKDAKLNVCKNIKVIYLLNENYAKASEYVIRTIRLAKSIGDNYEEAKSKIELGIIFKRINGYETSIMMMNEALKINIEDKKEEAYLKVYGYLNLAQMNIHKNNYDEASRICNKISEYKKYFSEDDYRDIDILKTISEIEIDIHENNLNDAKEKLLYCKSLIEIDKNPIYADKDLEYLIVEGRYYWKNREYEKAINTYERALNLCESRNNNSLKTIVLYDLENIAEETNDDKLRDIYYNKIMEFNKSQDDVMYRDYSYYIIEHMNNEVIMLNNIKNTKLVYIISTILIILSIVFSKLIHRNMKKIRYISMYDSLTNVLNRRILDKTYTDMINKGKNFGVIMIDVDNFKSINDTYGHRFGDTVLINICKTINSVLKENGELYRYGGEEFTVLIKSNSKQEVFGIAEVIRIYIEQMTWEENITVTVSVGVAYSDIESKLIIEKADKNLYKAKQTGKNKVVY